jgi:UDPglucose--hexose-1-phosphate uridylyltransferase
MSELRQDRTSGSSVIVAPQRGRRPQMKAVENGAQKLPRFDPSCPFCPGNEGQLLSIKAQTPMREPPGWSVRVVPNKFPAVQPESEAPAANGGHQAQPGKGVHEVVVESPWHNLELAGMGVAELNAVVDAYRERCRVLLARDESAAVILFRNYGRQAGASLAHPHAQVIALDVVPPRVAAISEWGRQYQRAHDRCAVCDELDIECKNGVRLVDGNDHFVTLVPFAAQYPCEQWLIPRRHRASFAALDDQEMPAFVDLLGRTLHRLQAALDDPPYNFVIDSAPKGELEAPHWHWRLRIVPDVTTWGGFELGAGLPINPSSPEDDARLLRATDPGSWRMNQ